MTDGLILLVAVILVGIGMGIVVWAVLIPPRVRLMTGREERSLTDRVQEMLDRAGLEMTASDFLRNGLLAGLAIGVAALVITTQPIFLILGPALGLGGYWILLTDRKTKHTQAYRHALATAVDIIRNTFGASPSVMLAMRNIAEYGPPLLRDDFALVYSRMSSGATFEEAIAPIQAKRKDLFLNQMVEALQLRERQGGSVRTLLDELANAIREQTRIVRFAQAQQRQAQISAVVSALAPMVFFMFLSMGSPEYRVFYHTLAGQIVLAIVVALCGVGYYLQYRAGTAGMDLEKVK